MDGDPIAAVGRLAGRSYLVTGISDGASLATAVARALAAEGAQLVCSGPLFCDVVGSYHFCWAARQLHLHCHD